MGKEVKERRVKAKVTIGMPELSFSESQSSPKAAKQTPVKSSVVQYKSKDKDAFSKNLIRGSVLSLQGIVNPPNNENLLNFYISLIYF